MTPIPLKSPTELRLMRTGGRRLAQIRAKLLKAVRPGVTGLQIEALAQKLIKKAGGQPSFPTVKGYHWATCINVNQGVVHGIPTAYRFQPGDLVTIDVGLLYQGFHTDCSASILVKGNQPPPAFKQRFLNVGRLALKKAIQQAVPGHRIGHISSAIETTLKKAGYSPIRVLTGHGIGRRLHEPPPIPGFLAGPLSQTPLIKKGMTLAIEVIYALGKPEVVTAPDGWTIQTQDGKIAAVFEETIAVLDDGPLILTSFP